MTRWRSSLLLAVVPAILARQMGRSALGCFVLALVLSHPTQVVRPFHTKGCVYEEKIDGWRLLALRTRAACGSSAGTTAITPSDLVIL